MKNQKLYLLFLQLSAARPQAYEPLPVQTAANRDAKGASVAALQGLNSSNEKHRGEA
jgi:hypothetical protein